MTDRTRRANGEGTVHYDPKLKRWVAMASASGFSSSIISDLPWNLLRPCSHPAAGGPGAVKMQWPPPAATPVFSALMATVQAMASAVQVG